MRLGPIPSIEHHVWKAMLRGIAGIVGLRNFQGLGFGSAGMVLGVMAFSSARVGAEALWLVQHHGSV